jgi:phospholipid/cholesterol/gamma-HCH transport system permease protein
MIISMVALNFYFDVIAIAGGLLVSGIAVQTPFWVSITNISKAITIVDIAVSISKNILFGAAIAIISCYHGLSASNIRMVPRVVFRAVVGSIIATLAINVIMTLWFYA